MQNPLQDGCILWLVVLPSLKGKSSIHVRLPPKPKIMTESDFVELLTRFEKGECTPQEEALLKKWFDSGDAAVLPFKEEAEKKRVLSRLRSSVYHQAGLTDNQRAISIILKIAASFLAAVLIGYAVYTGYHEGPVPDSLLVTISNDTIKKVHLPDGSIVWLKGHSRLTYPAAFSGPQRRVSLEGEALFEVEKDARHPFIIGSGDLTTTVLGTSFNIRSAKELVEVIVLAGKVSLASAQNVTVVGREEKAFYKKTKGDLEKADVLEEDRRRVTDGTEYNMYFEDTRMENVIRRIEQKFDIQVIGNNPRLNNCLITADFTDQSLQKTMDIISSITPIKYQFSKNAVTLTGDGCD
jgi:transmembrane sensor